MKKIWLNFTLVVILSCITIVAMCQEIHKTADITTDDLVFNRAQVITVVKTQNYLHIVGSNEGAITADTMLFVGKWYTTEKPKIFGTRKTLEGYFGTHTTITLFYKRKWFGGDLKITSVMLHNKIGGRTILRF